MPLCGFYGLNIAKSKGDKGKAKKMAKKNMKGGFVVRTKAGNTGYTYHSDDRINGKVQVHLIDENMRKTGQTVLSSETNLTVIGFLD